MTTPDYSRLEELTEMSAEELDDVRTSLEEFGERVYWLTRQIPPGRVATYGQLALFAGSPRAARAVGNLMRSSLEKGVKIPWHRVINSKGGISYRNDVSRATAQKRRLRDEGVEFENGRCDLGSCRWEPEVLFWEDDE